MTVTIKLHPSVGRNISVVIGGGGGGYNIPTFTPLEAEHAISGIHGTSGTANRSSLTTSLSKLVITNYEQTFDNETSWDQSILDQLAALARKNQVIVGQTAINKGPGTGDSIAVNGAYAQLVDAGATFTLSDVGRTITISGAPTPANNGVFSIIEFIDGTNIVYNNIGVVAEAAPGLTWLIAGDAALTPAAIRAL